MTFPNVQPLQVKRKGRPKGAKNKPKTAVVVETNEKTPTETFLTKKERNNYKLSFKLYKKGKITIPELLFETSTFQKIVYFYKRSTFRFEQFNE